MMYAATLAGIAFGNAGCHLPHGMSYAVSGSCTNIARPTIRSRAVRATRHVGGAQCAKSVYRLPPAPADRHLDAAQRLGADLRGATLADAGEVLAGQIIKFMQATQFPGDLSSISFFGARSRRAGRRRKAPATRAQKRAARSDPRRSARIVPRRARVLVAG